jgi:hypothetical protein
MIMLSLITKIKLELMAYEAMFAIKSTRIYLLTAWLMQLDIRHLVFLQRGGR